MATGLRPVAELPGVWRSPDTPAAGAGTYAFIVGVSTYDLLDGSPDTLGLSSLYVSALTAYRFFRYLSAQYEFDGGPMVEATLLLSPTPQEQALFDADPAFPISAQTAPRPTLDVLRDQLQAWYARLAALHPSDAENSRLFFFFSGHGLEMDPDRQLLLPADYPGRSKVLNNAISTKNIHRGLGSLPIASQYFFIDACRSDVPSLYNIVDLMGQEVLDVRRGQYDRDAPIMYASAPGGTAWQPTTPTTVDDVSFYGRVLLDALLVTGKNFRPDCSTLPCTISFFPLFTYVMRTLTADLKAHNINRQRPIAAGGIVRDSVVSHWTPPALTAADPNTEPDAHHPGGGGAVRAFLEVDITADGGIGPDATWEARPRASSRDITEPEAADLRSVSAVRLGRGDPALREAIGHRSVADLVSAAKILAWTPDDGWVPAQFDLTIVDVEQNADRSRVVVHYTCDNPTSWHWLHASANPLSYGFLHLGSEFETPVYALDFTMQLDAHGAAADRISDVVFRLSTVHNSPPLKRAAAVWDAYRASSAIGALEEIARLRSQETFPPRDGERALSPVEIARRLFFDNDNSPLATTIASMVLMRTDKYAEMRPWFECFASEVAESSDAAVCNLQSLRLRREYDATTALEYLEIVANLGTPATNEGSAYLISFINDFIMQRPDGPSPFGAAFDVAARDYVAQIFPGKNYFATIARSLRTGGLFTTLAAPDSELIEIRSHLA